MMRKAYGIGLTTALIVVVVALFLRNAPHIWDLQMWDETFYMATGIFKWDHHFRFYEISPLYSYIYRMAWHFTNNPATLHLWMGVAVVAAAIIVTAVSVLIVSQSLALAAAATAVMIASGYSDALPKLVYAAIAFVSLGFAISTTLPRFHSKMAAIALTAFIVTFIRPEFVVAFYVSAAASVIALAASYKTILKDRIWSSVTVACLAVIAALSKLWTFPVLSGGARALQAFGQHYSLYLYQIGKITVDPFANYERTLAEYLPGATSEMDALKKYPGKIIEYFLYNAANVFKTAFGAVHGIAVSHPILALAIVALLVWCLVKMKRVPFNYGDATSWAILAAPTAISVILIFARDHYLVVAATLMMLLAALAFRWAGARDTFIGAAALLILTTIVNPIPRATQTRVETASALGAQKPFGAMLEMDGGWCYYTPTVCRPEYATSAINDPVQYLNDAHINGVMVSVSLLRWAKENSHPQFLAFMENGAPGWTKVHLSTEYTLLRRDKLDMAGWGTVLTGNVMKYVTVDHIGAGPGTVRQLSDSVLFVHPGANDPTSMTMDLGRLARDSSCKGVDVTATLDKSAPPDAIARGAAVIGVTAYADGKEEKGVIRKGHDMTFSVESTSAPVRIVVDDHGRADTNWLNLDVEPTGCGT